VTWYPVLRRRNLLFKTVSQPPHYQPHGVRGAFLCFVDVYNILGLYSLDTSSTPPPSCDNHKYLQTFQMSLGGQNCCCLRTMGLEAEMDMDTCNFHQIFCANRRHSRRLEHICWMVDGWMDMSLLLVGQIDG
jgi:hypothetical protein